jgi:2-keto-4-pentenoate hydratase/2-oxohepta-3-ene-1,7-dioic acid hydratase in catechol pathway
VTRQASREAGVIWCRFSLDGEARLGLVENGCVREVEGDMFGEHVVGARTHALDAVTLLVPFVPKTFYCAGVNYRGHVEKMAAKRGVAPVFPSRPDIGYRANNALIAHGDAIVKPRDAGPNFQYEGELVAIFGKRAKNISREQALDCVFGWTIGNDVSERDWQASDRTLWRAKNSDTFKPMGPWIVTNPDFSNMRTNIRLNGELVDSFATMDMIFSAADYIVEMTRYITIEPGDMMWLGTDGLQQNMAPGDTIEIEITGIGVLRNRVVAED